MGGIEFKECFFCKSKFVWVYKFSIDGVAVSIPSDVKNNIDYMSNVIRSLGKNHIIRSYANERT